MDSQLPSDTRVIKTYVWHGKQCYFVSTINRESSAALAYGHRYAETMVFLFDWDKNEKTDIVHQDDDSEHSIRKHLSICQALHEKGLRGLRDDN
jgi:hypothetical protein